MVDVRHVNSEKGELWIDGRRHIAIDVAMFCRRLDTLVGAPVAKNILNNVEYWLGREAAESARKEHPDATVEEIVDRLIENGKASGIGVVELEIPEQPNGIGQIRIHNPAIISPDGAGKSILAAYWCGALSYLLKKQYESGVLVDDREKNILQSQLIPRSTVIGREDELAGAKSLLQRENIALLTLSGPAGVGKTCLALEISRTLSDQFKDGTFFVSLEKISDSNLLLSAIARTLGLTEQGNLPLLGILQGYLREKNMLLLLDNFDQLLASVSHVNELSTLSPKLKLLVTCREALHLNNEHVLAVKPLALPELKKLPSVDELANYPAIALFVQSAQSVKPDFALVPENARQIAEICVRLDGLPLALELAAVMTDQFSPKWILGHLESSFKISPHTAPDKSSQRPTLRDTIAWSYSLLSSDEKSLFERLSVFAGGCGLESAEAVCFEEAGQRLKALQLLTSLVAKNLLSQEEQGGEMRFRMLDTIHDFALDALAASGKEALVRRGHANLFLALAKQAEPQLMGQHQTEWLQRLDREHANLRLALDWALKSGESKIGLEFCASLWRFWYARGHLNEGRAWLSRALALSSDPTSVRAEILNGAGALAHTQGDYATARTSYEESLAIFRQLADRRGVAACLNNLGSIASEQGEYTNARLLYEESLAISRELADHPAMAYLLNNLALMAQQRGDYEESKFLFNESLAIKRQIKDKRGVAATVLNLGNIARDTGDYDIARKRYDESHLLFKELQEKRGITYCLINLGLVANACGNRQQARELFDASLPLIEELGDKQALAVCLQGRAGLESSLKDYRLASRLYLESIVLRRELGDKVGILESVEGIAAMVYEEGALERAARLFSATMALRRTLGVPLPPIEARDYETILSKVRTDLGEESFASAWKDGRALSLDDLIAEAMETQTTSPSQTSND